MTRLLLTGATGFIGRQLVAALTPRVDVHAVGRRPAADGDGVRWHQADLLEPGAAAQLVQAVRPTHLVHLAWYAVPGRFWTAPENVAWVEATLALLRAFAAAGGGRAVLAGSCAEYDWDAGICREDTTPLRPSTLYGACKHAVDAIAERWHPADGLRIARARLFHLYGPHEHPDRLVASVIRGALAGEPVACTEGTQVRDFLHVGDAAAAIAAVALSDYEGAVNIGSGERSTLRTIVETTLAELGAPDAARFGARPTPAGDPPVLVPDVARLRETIGWVPSFTLASGLSDTVRWWRTAATEARRRPSPG
jgi:nucleoside-diphosphate-sugar epimerase